MSVFRPILSTLRALTAHASIALVASIGLWGLSGCDVHEWPETDYSETGFELTLKFDTDLPVYQEILYTRAENDDESSRGSIYDHDLRHTIRIYPAGTGSKSRSDLNPALTYVFTESSTANYDVTYPIRLPEGKWDIYVWSDYVDRASKSDKYYDLTDFASIAYTDKDRRYEGSNVCREAYRGMTTVDVVHPYRFMEGETLPSYAATVEMERPLARFEFISTDVEEFVKQLPTISSRYKSRTDDEPSGDARGDDPSRSLSRADIEEFRVVFRYTAFMPSVYNMFTDRPVDSWTGQTFESRMDLVDDGILLGFDYQMVNGAETIANVACEVYNGNDELIAKSNSVEVPLLRSKRTIVKGEFLSSFGSGGVAIDPGFDGEFNIEIK